MNPSLKQIAATRPAWLTFLVDDPHLLPAPAFTDDARLYVAPDVSDELAAIVQAEWSPERPPEGAPITVYGVVVEVDANLAAGTWRWSEDGS